MPREITSATSLDNLRKEAKRWLKSLRTGDADARARFGRAHQNAPDTPVLRDVQHALAREYGLENWTALTRAVEKASAAPGLRALSVEGYEQLAQDFVHAYDAQDAAALQRLNAHYRRSFTVDDLAAEIWRRVYAFRQRSSKVPKNFLQIDEAHTIVATDAGFGSWSALMESLKTGAPPIPAYAIDPVRHAIAPRRQLNEREWADVIAVMRGRRIPALASHGLMTDALLARVAELDHVTALDLGGSRQVTDEGVRHLARMPQLVSLTLTGTKVTDRGLEVLRHLTNLRAFHLNWRGDISDAGLANLRYCERIEQVELAGSTAGDGAIEALQGKPHLRSFSTGRLVTDAGLRHLQNFPRLRQWHGEDTRLLIDGPFTNEGLASLAGLDGLFDLDLWHAKAITSAGFAHLASLPNLGALGADDELSDDEAMRHFASMPRLRKLRAQGAIATDTGFEALSRSQTLEEFWGRECPHLGSRGFVALSRMPSLRSLGVSCRNVDDEALATLPQFPALRDLTPIGVTDPGFRHIGRCERLERLSCMYCRETTDTATAHIAGLHLTSYYAGLTQITDRSLELLGRMTTLERLELYECLRVTDVGLAFLASLPNLREVHIAGTPGVTLQGTRVLPSRVMVNYST